MLSLNLFFNKFLGEIYIQIMFNIMFNKATIQCSIFYSILFKTFVFSWIVFLVQNWRISFRRDEINFLNFVKIEIFSYIDKITLDLWPGQQIGWFWYDLGLYMKLNDKVRFCNFSWIVITYSFINGFNLYFDNRTLMTWWTYWMILIWPWPLCDIDRQGQILQS